MNEARAACSRPGLRPKGGYIVAIQQTSAAGAPSPVAPASPAPRVTVAGSGSTAQGANPKANKSNAQPPRQLDELVREVRRVVEPVAQNLVFSLDEATQRTVVKVVDAATGEVIRQIPAEEMLAIGRTLDKLQGLLLHKEA